MFPRHDHPMKLDQAIDRQHRTKEQPSADLFEPPRPEQTSLRIRNVKSVDMTLLQPLDHEVSETCQEDSTCHARADAPDGDC